MANYKKNGERLPVNVGEVYRLKDDFTTYTMKIEEIKPIKYIEHVKYTMSMLTIDFYLKERVFTITSRQFLESFNNQQKKQNKWVLIQQANKE